MPGDEPPVEVGDIASTVMLSPCVGGSVRTWDESDNATLWSVPDADFLISRQGSGLLGRSPARGRPVHRVRPPGGQSPDSDAAGAVPDAGR